MVLLKIPSGRWETGPFEDSQSRDFESRLHFENQARLEHLRKLSQEELWDKELRNLGSYLKFTLVRVLQEGKILAHYVDSDPFAGAGHRRAPNTWCFNTGLISQALNPIYGVFFRVRLNAQVLLSLLEHSGTF